MSIEEGDPDPRSGLTNLIEELKRYGGALTVADEPSTTSASQAVRLLLPDDEYRAKKCRDILKQWHNTQS